MAVPPGSGPTVLSIPETTRAALKAALTLAGVQINDSARVLLANEVFSRVRAQTMEVVEATVEELGMADGAVLTQIIDRARELGLRPCPVVSGPFLRLASPNQVTAPDSVLSNGRAPTGSLTVASEPLRLDDSYPKGFYLRVVDEQPWLRGYRCSNEHLWSPSDRFAFRL